MFYTTMIVVLHLNCFYSVFCVVTWRDLKAAVIIHNVLFFLEEEMSKVWRGKSVPLCRLLSEGKPPPPSRHCSHCGHSHWSRSAGHNPIISDWLYSGRPTKRSTKNWLSFCAFLIIHVFPFNVRDLTVLEVEQQVSFQLWLQQVIEISTKVNYCRLQKLVSHHKDERRRWEEKKRQIF